MLNMLNKKRPVPLEAQSLKLAIGCNTLSVYGKLKDIISIGGLTLKVN